MKKNPIKIKYLPEVLLSIFLVVLTYHMLNLFDYSDYKLVTLASGALVVFVNGLDLVLLIDYHLQMDYNPLKYSFVAQFVQLVEQLDPGIVQINVKFKSKNKKKIKSMKIQLTLNQYVMVMVCHDKFV